MDAKHLGKPYVSMCHGDKDRDGSYQVFDRKFRDSSVDTADLRCEGIDVRLKILLCRAVIRIVRCRSQPATLMPPDVTYLSTIGGRCSRPSR